MTREFVEEYLDEKIKEKGELIICSFYDIRIKHGVLEQEVDEFLEYAKEILEYNDYQVYFTGAKYNYKHASKTVQDNEYIVAIKETEEQ